MRLDRVSINGFKNLKELVVDFDENKLTTVVIGQNGTGKSNLIEALVQIFRAYDLNADWPRFKFEVIYRINDHVVRLSNTGGRAILFTKIRDDEEVTVSRKEFEIRRAELFPDLVFGYYSGGSRRLEQAFDKHQQRYYDTIIKEDADYAKAAADRRLFYCRPVHGALALLSLFAVPHAVTQDILKNRLGVTGFHSAMAVLREPSWFNKSKWKQRGVSEDEKKRRGRRSYSDLEEAAYGIWGATGLAGQCVKALRDASLLPIALQDRVTDDYREKASTESRLACFLKDSQALKAFASAYQTERDLFDALEAIDISGLFRDIKIWVTRTNDDSGDVSFTDLSDGERQLLMVLGLIRMARGRKALFLLDEPDTHLNPVWQRDYLNLIEAWTERAGTEANCHIIMTSHNPLTISALSRDEVRVMYTEDNGTSKGKAPYVDPQGLGFTATLTEVFGLDSSLDEGTQSEIDERDRLVAMDNRSKEQERQLSVVNEKLDRLGFLLEDRDPQYQEFLRAKRNVQLERRRTLSPDELVERDNAMRQILRELLAKDGERPH
jgi:ABC-type cobalamin/Fe3+-siderophores transport system ATPase subunit